MNIPGLDAHIEGRYGPFTRSNPWSPDPVGSEDMLGERIFLPDEDAFATVEFAEEGEPDYDEDSGLSGGGLTYSLNVDGKHRHEVTITEDLLEDLFREQGRTPIFEYDR